MIPPDVASSLRLVIPDTGALQNQQTAPVPAAQRVADVLSNAVPGQRLLAEIQALLPNGTYRAIVAQRDITLALPFSAKPGDTLELEVAESDGKLILAFVANRSSGKTAASLPESVSTSLSTAGKVIGNLLTPLEGEGKQAPPAALNRSQPLVETMPKTGAELAPVLKQALTQSGMFYEAHQARWVSGQLPTAALLQEPQGKLSPAPANAPEFINRSSNFLPGSNLAPDSAPDAMLRMQSSPAASGGLAHVPPGAIANKSVPEGINPTVNRNFGDILKGAPLDRSATPTTSTPQPPALPTSAPNTTATPPTPTVPNENPVPRELVSLVQQQLNGLATQNFVWQGQVWPGQPMWWEISGDTDDAQTSPDGDSARPWQTRLKLDLPALGGIDVTLRLGAGGALAVSVSTEKPASEAKLRDSTQALREQLEAAGLTLTQLRVDHGQAGE
ncbi:MAG: flagellar hook-length control protein FliK [Gammaproteobacteria bacterium]|nr:flagellar hook-length control protein FliK [Gammaproteobacteria bacterium]MBU1602876.1 flagellar hook-length control protein FliK [Gammaproteobacteria bacterium]MBU2432548.1 flagellar hook-length control protein FliK [Gammaproteobacteria bacterium]MBU2448909.1 flagellar hook-length control protein FliK [Gammaproteobacteria bacterium]